MGEYNRKLRNRTIGGKDYKYIEYNFNERTYTTDSYVELRVDEEYKETLKTLGGTAGKLFLEPVLHFGEIRKVRVMTYLLKGMELVTLIKHEDSEGNVLDYRYTTSYQFIRYMNIFLESRQKFILKEDTTFKYLDDEHILKLGRDFYEPKSVKDTGYELRGNILEYEETYEIDRMDSIPKEGIGEDKNKFHQEMYKRYDISRTILKMNEVEGAYGDVGEIQLIKSDGKALNYMDYTYLYYIVEENRDITYEDTVLEETKDVAEDVAYSLNKVIDRRYKPEDEVTKQEIAYSLFERFNQEYETKIEINVGELLEKEYSERIDKLFLEYLLKNNKIR